MVLRHSHRAGEKLFVDYACPKVPIFDQHTGAVQFEASLFVAVLGASNYIFCEADRAEDLPHWLQGHVHAFEDFGGVPAIVIPDNPKASVHKPYLYEPDLSPSYADLCPLQDYADQATPGTRSLDVTGLAARVTPCGAA